MNPGIRHRIEGNLNPDKKTLACVVAFSLLIGATNGANLLTNPGFETDAVLNAPPIAGATGWTTFNGAATASANGAPTRTGIGSLMLPGAGGFSVPGAYQTFPASPGELWDLQGYLLATNTLPSDATFGVLKIVWSDGVNDLNPGSAIIGNAINGANPGIEALPHLDSTATPNTWTFAHAQGLAPPGTTQVKLYALFVDQSAGTGFFDDLQATNAPPTSTPGNSLVNPGFETNAVLNAAPVPGAAGWTTFGNAFTVSSNGFPTRTGIGSLMLAGSGGFGVPGAYQAFPASPGEHWDFQGYLLATNTLAADATFGLLKIVWNDGVNDLNPGTAIIGSAVNGANPGIEALPHLDSTATPNTWIFAHAQGVAPASTAQVKLYALFVDQSAGTGFFDDLAGGLLIASPPKLQGTAVSGTNITMGVALSQSGFNYVLQSTSSLQPTSWTSIQTNVGTGGALGYTVPITAGNPQLFFRINVQ
jgi:hypothetical protein